MTVEDLVQVPKDENIRTCGEDRLGSGPENLKPTTQKMYPEIEAKLGNK